MSLKMLARLDVQQNEWARDAKRQTVGWCERASLWPMPFVPSRA
jgi:hypothetical protein